MGSRARRCQALRAQFAASWSDHLARTRPAFRLGRRAPSPSHEALVARGIRTAELRQVARWRSPLQLQEDASGRADHRRPAPLLAWPFKAGRHSWGHQTICPKLHATRPPEAHGYSCATAFAECCSRATASLSADGKDCDELSALRCLSPSSRGSICFHGKACEDAGVEPATLPIVLGELSFNRSAFESEFAATPEPRQVRITWNGIASLWAFG